MIGLHVVLLNVCAVILSIWISIIACQPSLALNTAKQKGIVVSITVGM